ncbi:MAG: MFS transporter [Myxococcota bacterium]|nr:MFS transporter [Myxococcota bacterium]
MGQFRSPLLTRVPQDAQFIVVLSRVRPKYGLAFSSEDPRGWLERSLAGTPAAHYDPAPSSPPTGTPMTEPAPENRKALFILLGVVVIDLIGFGVAIPVLPYLAREQNEQAWVLGALLASYAAMQFLFAPLWGRLSDRIGRRPVILVTIAGTSACLLLLGLSDSIVWLFVARIAGGIFGANIGVASAYITDLTEPEERTRWMGLIGASFAVGFTLGPVIGGPLSLLGYGAPMLFASALAATNFVFAASVLREPTQHREEEEASEGRVQLLRHNARLRRLVAINFVFTFAVCQLESMFVYFMKGRFDYEPWDVAAIMFLMALVMMGIQGGGIQPLSRRFGEKRLLIAGVSLMAVAFFAVPAPLSVPILLLPLVVSAAGRAISQPAMMSLVSLEASAHQRGVVMGGFQSASSLARTIGPLIAGVLFDRSDAWPFYCAGILMIVALPLVWGLTQHATPDENAPA